MNSELKNFLPENALAFVHQWLKQHRTEIRISRPRKNKLGDYKRIDVNYHKISVNGNLNPHAFFFVLTHEIAHLLCSVAYRSKIQPHGKEWKFIFKELLLESLEVYPNSLKPIIINHSLSPKANVLSDRMLTIKLLGILDENKTKLEEVEQGKVFRIGKRKFRKIKKRKIRYLCEDISNRKMYLIHGLAEIDEII